MLTWIFNQLKSGLNRTTFIIYSDVKILNILWELEFIYKSTDCLFFVSLIFFNKVGRGSVRKKRNPIKKGVIF